MLTKEQILQADDQRTVDVEVPEWGGSVRVRVMSSADRQRFQSMVITKNGKPDELFIEKLVVHCMVDETGKQMFDNIDIKQLACKSSVAINRVFEAAAELNGMTQKSVEDIEKN